MMCRPRLQSAPRKPAPMAGVLLFGGFPVAFSGKIPARQIRGRSIILNYISYLVPAEGIEPPTFGLQNRCSTAELSRQNQTIISS